MTEETTQETPVLDPSSGLECPADSTNGNDEAGTDTADADAPDTKEPTTSESQVVEQQSNKGTDGYHVLSKPTRTGRNFDIGSTQFKTWFYKQEARRNLEDGYGTTRNDPTNLADDEDHSPSQMMGCHRMREYSANGAPRENHLPYGIFQFGHNTEELFESFLQGEVLTGDEFIQNSIHVSVDHNDISISGSTDPVVCDKQGNPLLLTECKTLKNIHPIRNEDEPKRRHKAQAHAYMKGLQKKYDLEEPPTAVIVYFGRERLVEMESFFIDFDPEFWADVTDWAEANTEHRRSDEALAPVVDPDGDQAYQCGYCDYRERCGNYQPGPHPWNSYSANTHEDEKFPPAGVDEEDWKNQGTDYDYWYDTEMHMHLQNTHEDQPATGFLPMFDYHEAAVVEHLLAHPEVKLTPALAHAYPDLVADGSDPAERYFDRYGAVPQADVHDLHCPACNSTYDWDSQDWDGDIFSPPTCPKCNQSHGSNVTLRGPSPDAQ